MHGRALGGHDERVTDIRIHAPDAEQVWVVVDGVDRPLTPVGPEWRGSVPDGTRYGIRAAGDPERRFDPSRVLIDPRATAVWFGGEHERDRCVPDNDRQRRRRGDRAGIGGGDAVARAAAPALDDPPARRVRGARARADDAS